jgi:hypothetical protein
MNIPGQIDGIMVAAWSASGEKVAFSPDDRLDDAGFAERGPTGIRRLHTHSSCCFSYAFFWRIFSGKPSIL